MESDVLRSLPKRAVQMSTPLRPKKHGTVLNELPTWNSLPLENKHPMPSLPSKDIVLVGKPLGKSLHESFPNKDFDLNTKSVRPARVYNSLHDPNLRRHFRSSPGSRRHLVKRGLVTPDGRVRPDRLEELNQYRTYLHHLWSLQVGQLIRQQEMEEKKRLSTLLEAVENEDPLCREIVDGKDKVQVNDVLEELPAKLNRKCVLEQADNPLIHSLVQWNDYQDKLLNDYKDKFPAVREWLNDQTKNYKKFMENKMNSRINKDEKMRARWERFTVHSRAHMSRVTRLQEKEQENKKRRIQERTHGTSYSRWTSVNSADLEVLDEDCDAVELPSRFKKSKFTQSISSEGDFKSSSEQSKTFDRASFPFSTSKEKYSSEENYSNNADESMFTYSSSSREWSELKLAEDITQSREICGIASDVIEKLKRKLHRVSSRIELKKMAHPSKLHKRSLMNTENTRVPVDLSSSTECLEDILKKRSKGSKMQKSRQEFTEKGSEEPLQGYKKGTKSQLGSSDANQTQDIPKTNYSKLSLTENEEEHFKKIHQKTIPGQKSKVKMQHSSGSENDLKFEDSLLPFDGSDRTDIDELFLEKVTKLGKVKETANVEQCLKEKVEGKHFDERCNENTVRHKTFEENSNEDKVKSLPFKKLVNETGAEGDIVQKQPHEELVRYITVEQQIEVRALEEEAEHLFEKSKEDIDDETFEEKVKEDIADRKLFEEKINDKPKLFEGKTKEDKQLLERKTNDIYEQHPKSESLTEELVIQPVLEMFRENIKVLQPINEGDKNEFVVQQHLKDKDKRDKIEKQVAQDDIDGQHEQKIKEKIVKHDEERSKDDLVVQQFLEERVINDAVYQISLWEKSQTNKIEKSIKEVAEEDIKKQPKKDLVIQQPLEEIFKDYSNETTLEIKVKEDICTGKSFNKRTKENTFVDDIVEPHEEIPKENIIVQHLGIRSKQDIVKEKFQSQRFQNDNINPLFLQGSSQKIQIEYSLEKARKLQFNQKMYTERAEELQLDHHSTEIDTKEIQCDQHRLIKNACDVQYEEQLLEKRAKEKQFEQLLPTESSQEYRVEQYCREFDKRDIFEQPLEENACKDSIEQFVGGRSKVEQETVSKIHVGQQSLSRTSEIQFKPGLLVEKAQELQFRRQSPELEAKYVQHELIEIENDIPNYKNLIEESAKEVQEFLESVEEDITDQQSLSERSNEDIDNQLSFVEGAKEETQENHKKRAEEFQVKQNFQVERTKQGQLKYQTILKNPKYGEFKHQRILTNLKYDRNSQFERESSEKRVNEALLDKMQHLDERDKHNGIESIEKSANKVEFEGHKYYVNESNPEESASDVQFQTESLEGSLKEDGFEQPTFIERDEAVILEEQQVIEKVKEVRFTKHPLAEKVQKLEFEQNRCVKSQEEIQSKEKSPLKFVKEIHLQQHPVVVNIVEDEYELVKRFQKCIPAEKTNEAEFKEPFLIGSAKQVQFQKKLMAESDAEIKLFQNVPVDIINIEEQSIVKNSMDAQFVQPSIVEICKEVQYENRSVLNNFKENQFEKDLFHERANEIESEEMHTKTLFEQQFSKRTNDNSLKKVLVCSSNGKKPDSTSKEKTIYDCQTAQNEQPLQTKFETEVHLKKDLYNSREKLKNNSTRHRKISKKNKEDSKVTNKSIIEVNSKKITPKRYSSLDANDSSVVLKYLYGIPESVKDRKTLERNEGPLKKSESNTPRTANILENSWMNLTSVYTEQDRHLSNCISPVIGSSNNFSEDQKRADEQGSPKRNDIDELEWVFIKRKILKPIGKNSTSLAEGNEYSKAYTSNTMPFETCFCDPKIKEKFLKIPSFYKDMYEEQKRKLHEDFKQYILLGRTLYSSERQEFSTTKHKYQADISKKLYKENKSKLDAELKHYIVELQKEIYSQSNLEKNKCNFVKEKLMSEEQCYSRKENELEKENKIYVDTDQYETFSTNKMEQESELSKGHVIYSENMVSEDVVEKKDIEITDVKVNGSDLTNEYKMEFDKEETEESFETIENEFNSDQDNKFESKINKKMATPSENSMETAEQQEFIFTEVTNADKKTYFDQTSDFPTANLTLILTEEGRGSVNSLHNVMEQKLPKVCPSFTNPIIRNSEILKSHSNRDIQIQKPFENITKLTNNATLIDFEVESQNAFIPEKPIISNIPENNLKPTIYNGKNSVARGKFIQKRACNFLDEKGMYSNVSIMQQKKITSTPKTKVIKKKSENCLRMKAVNIPTKDLKLENLFPSGKIEIMQNQSGNVTFPKDMDLSFPSIQSRSKPLVVVNNDVPLSQLSSERSGRPNVPILSLYQRKSRFKKIFKCTKKPQKTSSQACIDQVKREHSNIDIYDPFNKLGKESKAIVKVQSSLTEYKQNEEIPFKGHFSLQQFNQAVEDLCKMFEVLSFERENDSIDILIDLMSSLNLGNTNKSENRTDNIVDIFKSNAKDGFYPDNQTHVQHAKLRDENVTNDLHFRTKSRQSIEIDLKEYLRFYFPDVSYPDPVDESAGMITWNQSEADIKLYKPHFKYSNQLSNFKEHDCKKAIGITSADVKQEIYNSMMNNFDSQLSGSENIHNSALEQYLKYKSAIVSANDKKSDIKRKPFTHQREEPRRENQLDEDESLSMYWHRRESLESYDQGNTSSETSIKEENDDLELAKLSIPTIGENVVAMNVPVLSTSELEIHFKSWNIRSIYKTITTSIHRLEEFLIAKPSVYLEKRRSQKLMVKDSKAEKRIFLEGSIKDETIETEDTDLDEESSSC